MADSVHMSAAVPVFLVADVDATLAWYREHLGFETEGFPGRPPYVFGFLRHGRIEFFLQRVEGHRHQSPYRLRPAGGWDAYVRMLGLDAYFATVREKVTVLEPPTRRPYGQTEFVIEDCNGYVLVFSEPINNR